ncbi:MAG: sulfite exporter TauE/SafE family protein, partial [Pseudomonadales bacterium]
LEQISQQPPGAITLIAVATSLSCVLGTSLAAARAQIRAGNVQWPVVQRWGPPLVLGALLAGTVAERLPAATMRGLIGGFLVFVALVMLTRWQPHPNRDQPGHPLTVLLGTTGGIISGMAGIGGGNVIVPTLVFFNTPMHKATANSSTLGVPIAVAGVLGYAWAALQPAADTLLPAPMPGLVGYLYWPATLLIVTAAMLAAPFGVRLAQRIDAVPLRRLFGLLLLTVAARMIYSAVLLAS